MPSAGSAGAAATTLSNDAYLRLRPCRGLQGTAHGCAGDGPQSYAAPATGPMREMHSDLGGRGIVGPLPGGGQPRMLVYRCRRRLDDAPGPWNLDPKDSSDRWKNVSCVDHTITGLPSPLVRKFNQ